MRLVAAWMATAGTAAPAPAPAAQHPQRRGFAEEQRGQGQDDDQSWHDKRGAADQGAETAPQSPRAEDRELSGGRAGAAVVP